MSDSERLRRYMDDFGERLSGAAPAQPRARRRPLFVAAVATTAVVVVALVAGASGERLDPVAEARAALAPRGEIVYMKITSDHSAPEPNRVPPPQTTEQWSTGDPARWRFVQTFPDSPRGGGVFDQHGRIVGRQELAYGEGAQSTYNAERDTLDIVTGYRDRHGGRGSRIPSLLGTGSGDPQADLSALLTDGEISDEGELQVGGRTVRRFVSELRRGGPLRLRRLVYDVDPRTFAPIQATVSFEFSGERMPRITTRLHVDEYRRIPLNETTERLLHIRTTPKTKITVRTAQELRERAARWRARCRPLKSGRLACPPPGPAPKIP